MKTVIALLMILAAYGCAQVDSGIYGEVKIGPQCPAPSNENYEQCKDKPYAATLTIRSNGKEVAKVTADAQGKFNRQLAPGVYTIKPSETNSTYPRAVEQTVRVQNGKFTNVSILFDSGIR